MFDSTPQPPPIRTKTLYLIRNSHPDKMLKYQYQLQLSRSDIARFMGREWGDKWANSNNATNNISQSSSSSSLGHHSQGLHSSYSTQIRLFTVEGVEIDEEDLTYARDGDRMYASLGEDYDSQRNFGQYEQIRVLGEGGFGKVSLARSLLTGQEVAFKILKTEKIATANDIDMIFREIQNLRALSHPNIVKIINCYALQNMRVVVVMQYLEGGQLLTRLRTKNKFEQMEARIYFKQIAEAVAYCHDHGIIHRDLKLENILIKQGNIVKVADFGISGVANQFNRDADVGTLRYMAPQVLAGRQKNNSAAVDVWSCGVILYYMLVGRLPFTGVSSAQIIATIVAGKYILPMEQQLSQPCRSLIERLLETDPKKRIKMNELLGVEWLCTSFSLPLIPAPPASFEQEAVIKRQPRKTVNPRAPPKLSLPLPMVPKRLEKQKKDIFQQLQGYRQRRGTLQRAISRPIAISQELRGSSFSKLPDSSLKKKSTNIFIWK